MLAQSTNTPSSLWKWSTRNAFFWLNHNEIMELATEMSGKQPGQPGFLGDQDMTTTLLNDVTPKGSGGICSGCQGMVQGVSATSYPIQVC